MSWRTKDFPAAMVAVATFGPASLASYSYELSEGGKKVLYWTFEHPGITHEWRQTLPPFVAAHRFLKRTLSSN